MRFGKFPQISRVTSFFVFFVISVLVFKDNIYNVMYNGGYIVYKGTLGNVVAHNYVKNI